MVRTELVNLSTIPASAYRQKLQAGGAGIVILRADCKQPGMATISKTSGEPILDEKNPKKYYPKKAFHEAITLTARLPYNKRSIPKLEPVEKAPEKKIRLYVAGTKFRNITGNEELTDKQVLKIAEILDGMGKEGVFSELNSEIRRKLKK